MDPTQFLTIDVKTEEGNLGEDKTGHSDLPVATDKDAEEGHKELCDIAEKSDEQGEKGKEAAEVDEEPEVEGMDIKGKRTQQMEIQYSAIRWGRLRELATTATRNHAT